MPEYLPSSMANTYVTNFFEKCVEVSNPHLFREFARVKIAHQRRGKVRPPTKTQIAVQPKAADPSNEIDKTSVSMSASSAGTLIGFCFAVLTLLVTYASASITNKTAFYATFFVLILAIVFFATATEFYITAAWKPRTVKQYREWALLGSTFYSLGMGWLVISIGLMFLALTNFPWLPYFAQVAFLASWITLFVIRTRASPEPQTMKRWVIRALMLIQILFGITAVYVLSGR